MNLLIVDDEVIAVKGLLAGIDWVSCGIDGLVRAAQDAASAEEILRRETVDLILCDIEMPGENGIDLIRKVHEEKPEIPVIFLTCHAKFEYAQEAVRLGCVDYILTPATYETISATVRKAVNELKEKRQAREAAKYGSRWLYEQEKKIEVAQGRYRTSASIVADMDRYIQSNLSSEDLSVSKLARRSFLNEDYLNRIFKQEKGVSLKHYIIRERMALAAKLLQNQNLSVAAIADCVGYPNYTYFVTAFKKHFGETPTQHRASHCDPQDIALGKE